MAPPVAGHGADVAGGAAEPGDEQEILVPPDQRRHRLAAVEDEPFRNGLRQIGGRVARCHRLPQNGLAPISF
jgi:hypothetical protein